MASRAELPRATYRLQFRQGFDFARAREVVAYLASFGATHLYASPIMRARDGSTHGYDTVDHTALDPTLGSEAEFDALVAEARAHGMGLVLDIVPNHMATAPENQRWWDVLKHGTESRYASFFDIDWSTGRVLVPVLGEPYGEALDAMEVRDGELRYHDHRFPISGPPVCTGRDAIHALLERQAYRLAHWRLASHRINYRRFFDITDLIAVRVEDPEVFDDVHRLILELCARGAVDGLRVDHVDGLTDPEAYVEQLARADVPVWVEKILGEDEEIPKSWPVAGSTGYEFTRDSEALFVDPDGWRALCGTAALFTGETRAFSDVVRACKRQVLREHFGAELAALVSLLEQIASDDLIARDLPTPEIERAVIELTAALPVYRTYVSERGASSEDVETIERAAAACRAVPAMPFVVRVLTLRDVPPGDRERWVRACARWQQLSGPAMAKGFEDTALYRWMPLVARNEVGGEPGDPPHGVDEFHRRMQRRPLESLNAGSTHDTKRSEDVRARLAVLSELADEWTRLVRRWRERHAPLRRDVDGATAPSGIDELLCYQTIVGAWPFDPADERDFQRRVNDYMQKAAREAKDRTSWLDPNEEYERVLSRFVRGLFKEEKFVREARRFAEKIALPGALNSLAGSLMRIAAPGIPDVYQGTELWTLRLVDPDNRAPVDFEARARMLESLRARDDDDALVPELLDSWRDGRIKMWVMHRALRARAQHDEVFARGAYVPLRARGPRKDNVVAFARVLGGRAALCVVPRLTGAARDWPVGEQWRGTSIAAPDGAPDRWVEAITGRALAAKNGRLQLREVFERAPVALLVPE